MEELARHGVETLFVKAPLGRQRGKSRVTNAFRKPALQSIYGVVRWSGYHTSQQAFRRKLSLFREPDAGNLPVRFDEREQETGPSQTGLRWRGESQTDLHWVSGVNYPFRSGLLI